MALILHIGIWKTGTTAMQSILARNVELLRDFGLHYPEHPMMEDARRGGMSSGNIDFAPGEDWADVVLSKAQSASEKDVLFSREQMTLKISDEPDQLDRLTAQHPVKIILFLRDPIDFVGSYYAQVVKQAGYGGSLADFANTSDTFQRVRLLLSVFQDKGIPVELANYSRCSKSLADRFFGLLLGQSSDAFLAKADILDVPVNRSLTRSELMLQSALNKADTKQPARFLSKGLIENLPIVEHDPLPVPATIVEQLRDRIGPDIDAINKMVPSSEKLIWPDPVAKSDQQGDEVALFSQDQINQIANSIAQELNQNTLANTEVGALMRIAKRANRNNPRAREDLITLLTFLHRVRPANANITQMLQDLSDGK
ncbi:hypothetical protein [Thalassococcus lentus]|uniref:Sulfotransferase domain-containing protein n=1 Tax=Thalassococcus lentus TaxID=1210524 RepID=A0ABT4XRG9_9RHOB|nr:hypothetical protein [Thalassococcus lentus]MDA7424552.1 hypothetical protein [Thalassococcus lentus]